MNPFKLFLFDSITEIEGSNTSEGMKNFYFLSCLRDQLSENCTEFQVNPRCNKVKRYLKQCPDSRPKTDRLAYDAARPMG